MSAIDRIAIRRVDVERATVISAQPFAAVVSKLAAAIGHPDMSEFARNVIVARTSADLEVVVNEAIGAAGLMEMAHFDIGEVLRKDMPGAPKGREEVPVQVSRLLHAHEIVLKEARAMARRASEAGDDGTNDLIVSGVIRRNELQVWFVAEHIVNVPIVEAS